MTSLKKKFLFSMKLANLSKNVDPLITAICIKKNNLKKPTRPDLPLMNLVTI